MGQVKHNRENLMKTKAACQFKHDEPHIHVEESYFKTHDNHRLYYQSHVPEKPRAVLIVTHGFSEHAGRYKNFINTFSNEYAIYVFDLRGHGRSDGIRAHVDEFDDFVEDLRLFVDMVAKGHKSKKKFLIAHSMGGQIAVNYLAKYPDNPLAGLITSSANIKVAVPINFIKRYLGLALSHIFPTMRLCHDINTKWISTDPETVRSFERDPLVHPHITVNLARHIFENQDTIMDKACRITLPVLMLHGGADLICTHEGTEDFFKNLKSRDKKMKIYDGMYHEIFNELKRETVFSDIRQWLEKRV